MATYLPGHAPTSLGIKKKKPTQKPQGSFDPSGSLGGFSPKQLAAMSPDELAQVQFALGMAGPPQPDFEALQAAALRSAQASAQPQIDYINQERARQDARQKLSSDAATNFSSAFAQILQGGKTGAEGEQYALENFGGSYLGGIAARMGQQLISQQQSYFDEQDYKLAAQLADIVDAIPGEADKMYQDLVEQTEDILTAPYKNQIAAIAALISEKRKSAGAPETKNFSDGTTRQWNQKTGKWDVVTSEAAGGADISTVTQPGGAVVGYDKNTGKVVYKIPGVGTATGGSGTVNGTAAGKPISFSAASEYARSMTSNTGTLWKVRKTKGGGFEAYDTGKAKAGSGGTSGSGSGDNVSTTVARATEAGKDALETVLANIAVKFPAPDPKTDPEGFERAKAAYQAWLDSGKSFRSAITRVTVAIGPHLKNIGYTPSQIKRAAYEIVSAEMRPPKGYKPPKASAARVAANNLVTAKTGIVTNSPWKGTHITDGLDWNHGQRTAVDIMGRAGMPVGAPEDGTIVRWGSAQGGQALYFQGVSGRRYWLGHIDNMLPVGARVQANQQIATISSDHPRPHLHIDVTGGGV